MTTMLPSPTSTKAAATGLEVESRLREILATPEGGGDVLDQLVRAELVMRPDGLTVQDVIATAGRDLTAAFRDGAVAPAVGAIGRVDPRTSRAKLAGGRTLGMYVQDCLVSTEANPAYHRLPSFPAYFPYHIVYLLGFGPNESHTVNVTMRVYSPGTVTITTTGNPTAAVLGQSSVPLTIPVTLKTTAQGFASVLLMRSGATGFDWFAADVF